MSPSGLNVRSNTRSHQKWDRWQRSTAWLFVSPFVAIFVVFTAFPAAVALFYSFTDLGIGSIRHPFEVHFVGLNTFRRVLSDALFRQALVTTILDVVIGVPVTMLIGLVLAVSLDSGISRLRAVYRSAFYLPVITNIVAAAVIWQYAFTLGGPINSLLAALGLPGPNWLGDSNVAFGTVLTLAVWRNIGTCMVLFLAGLQSIQSDVYEAASIDGASGWQKFLFITLPMLQPSTLLVTVLMTVSFMNIFDEPFLVTKGGPLGTTRSIALWVYDQFGNGNIAPAMAGSYVMVAIVIVLSIVQLRFIRGSN